MKAITDYYENYNEDMRLTRDNAHQVEYLTTTHYFDQLIPATSTILDVCAGTGIYSFYLAQQGHMVTACDISAHHVELIKSKPESDKLAEIAVSNVLDLSRFDDGAFDVVLCMGALYHLNNINDREKCLSECLRVLKVGGLFVGAYINRHAVCIQSFLENLSDEVQERKELAKTGVFNVFYGMDFKEINTLTNQFPLEKIVDIGIDGLAYPLSQWLNNLTSSEFEEYMGYHISTCEQPSIIGNSIHGLWIGRKSG